jgi:hypothetical protein
VANRAVAADQNDLMERRTDAALFEQPEQTFDRDIHHIVGSFFAGCEVQDVRDSVHGLAHQASIRDAAANDFDASAWFQKAVMTKSPDAKRPIAGSMEECGP